jgi:hypothetical protein
MTGVPCDYAGCRRDDAWQLPMTLGGWRGNLCEGHLADKFHPPDLHARLRDIRSALGLPDYPMTKRGVA